MTLTVGSLCTGYGGLELALNLAGLDTKTAWWSEIDPHAAKVAERHHPDAPNLGDLTQITNPPTVDIVTAGFPCQPVSPAGKQQGIDDERWLIDDVVSVWERSRARWLVLENVPGLLSANRGEAFGRVVDALTKVSCSAQWTHLRAADIGAPHKRERWFCIAVSDTERGGRDGRTRAERRDQGERAATGRRSETPPRNTEGSRWYATQPPRPQPDQQPERSPRGPDSAPTDTSGVGLQTHDDLPSSTAAQLPRPSDGNSNGDVKLLPTPTSSQQGGDVDSYLERKRTRRMNRINPTVTDLGMVLTKLLPTPTSTDGARDWTTGTNVCLNEAVATPDFGKYQAAVNHWANTIGRPAPAPTQDGRLNPQFVEWMMGLPEGHVTNTPELSRPQMLKILGNGIVPQQAAKALQTLDT